MPAWAGVRPPMLREAYEQLVEIIFTDFTSSFCEVLLLEVPVVPVAVVPVVPVVAPVDELPYDDEISLPVTSILWPTCLSRSELLPSSVQVSVPERALMALVPDVVPVADVPLVPVVPVDVLDMPLSLWAFASV